MIAVERNFRALVRAPLCSGSKIVGSLGRQRATYTKLRIMANQQDLGKVPLTVSESRNCVGSQPLCCQVDLKP
jgi:hypothetical protein